MSCRCIAWKRDVAKPPNWKDVDGLVDYVTQAINDLLEVNNDWDKLCAEYGLASYPLYSESYTRHFLTWDTYVREREREAIDIAEHGKFVPLAELLLDRSIRASLQQSTFALIADILCGRKRKPAHRPKQTEIERRANNPIHDAADEVPAVQRMLRAWYPEQTKNQIYDRALSVVARRHDMRSEALATHLKRSKTDRRRLP
jgi:hypothetical protein